MHTEQLRGQTNTTPTQDTGSTQERAQEHQADWNAPSSKSHDGLRRNSENRQTRNTQNAHFYTKYSTCTMYTECTFTETERECWKWAKSFLFIIHYGSHLTFARTHMHTLANTHWCIRGKHLHPHQCYWKHWMALNGWHSGLPAKVPLLRHSLMRLARRTWKALVISWFMKLSRLRTLATIIRRSNTSSSSAMVATCIRSPRPSSRLPVYRYWSTAWEQSKVRSKVKYRP